MKLRNALVAGGLAAGLALAGTAAYAASGSAIPSNTVHGCVVGPNRTLQNVFSSPTRGTTCASGFRVVMNGPDSDPVGTGPPTASASIAVTNDPDTAAVPEPLSFPNGGIWALDNFTFNISITDRGAADLSRCPSAPAGNATCEYYTGSASIGGTFQSLGGGTVSPLHGSPMNGIVDGTINGAFDFEFYADSTHLSAAGVSTVINNNNEQFAQGTGDGKWYGQFFPAGTTLDSSAGPNAVAQPDYSFTYLATSESCTSPQVQETMVQAFNHNTGDITGNCASS